MENQTFYKIALSLIPGIGGVLARNLLSHAESEEAIFREPLSALKRIPGIGEVNARNIKDKKILVRAEKELKYITESGIRVLFYTEKEFPRRLKSCNDSPILLYTLGNMNLNENRVVSVVGTRNATEYGKRKCEELIKAFSDKGYKILVVSGLAYGIDIQAHKSSLKYDIPTVAVLGHGLDKTYPSIHTEIAKKMLENGGLITDFPSGTRIDPSNFIRRNRIVAGMADATLVVESAIKGGALITADIAGSYNRDVFAFPGRSGDPYSKGCNQLIRNNGANLVEGIDDLEYFMGWEMNKPSAVRQSSLFIDLSPEEEKILELLSNGEVLFIDQISAALNIPTSRISAILLNLEFKNVVTAMPGNMYKIK